MSISNDKLKLDFVKNKGTFNIYNEINKLVIKNAYGSLQCDKGLITTLGLDYKLSQSPYQGYLGKGTKTRIDFLKKDKSDPIHFQIDFIKYEDHPFITIELTATNESDIDLLLEYLSPLSINAKKNDAQGGLFIGQTPEDALIFENGLGFTLEFFMRGMNAREESNSSFMEYIYTNPHHEENFLMGLISFPGFLGEIISNDEEDEGIILDDGREGIAEWRAQLTFPFPKSLPAGDSISTGTWIIRINAPNGFTALEEYADTIRIYKKIRLWPHAVPHGWNSWCNPLDGYREYSYSTGITEDIIIDNMMKAVENLKPFGLKYWQLDNGYSPGNVMTVDVIMEDRFPHGMKWLANKMREQGLIPGIWINPFNVGINSQLFKEKEKEGWFPKPDPSFPVKDSSWRALDTSHPDVQNYIRHCIRKVTKEWGYDFLKVDFAYMNLGGTKFYNKTMVSSEIHQLGYKLIREEAGPEVFIFGIGGPLGLHFGIIDGERITFDTMPIWHDKRMPVNSFDVPTAEGSVLFNYRTMARRYYLQNRVWINHLDCLSFRPSMEWNESMCLNNAAALLGGIFKIGDKLVDMKLEEFAVFQRMLPIYRDGARPIDVFRMLIPEILHLHIDKPFLKWDIVGLFHWGPNRDIMNGEVETTGDKKIITLELDEIGLENNKEYIIFDFWNEKSLGTFKKSFEQELEPRNSLILSIHESLNRPQYISSNRHITQGGVELTDITWNEDNKDLKAGLDIVKGFEHHIYFYIPDSYEIVDISTNIDEDFENSLIDNILKIWFIENKSDNITINMNTKIVSK